MKPASVAVAVAAVAAFAALGVRTTRDSVPSGTKKSVLPPALSAPCPPGTLPDDGVCVPVPAAPRPSEANNAERIPRRPDRDPDYARYELPVLSPEHPTVEANAGSSGPDGGPARAGIVVNVRAGAPVRVVSLEGQEGPASVVYAGSLMGGSLVTLHVVHERDRQREYLVVLGNVGQVPAVAPRAKLPRDAPAGTTTLAPLTLDVRLVRPNTDVWSVAPNALTDDATSISVDPRNVLERVR